MKMENINNKFTNYFNFDDIIVSDILINKKNDQPIYFIELDGEERFKKNLITQPADWYYRTKEITYDINSYGYRTKEFDDIDWKESIVIFGCSNVFGIGLAEDETISNNISQLTGRYVVNMGMPGCSNYISFYNSMMMKKKYGIPYAVIFLWTDSNRYSYFTKEKIISLGSWYAEIYNDIKNKKYTDSQKKWATFFDMLTEDFSHNIISNYFLIESIREFWEEKTIYGEGSYFFEYLDKLSPYYSSRLQPFMFNEYELARDLGHPGREINKIAAKILIEKYEIKI